MAGAVAVRARLAVDLAAAVALRADVLAGIDPARAAALTDDGVKPAATIREAAGGADVLVLMVATPDQVENVLFGDDPAADALSPGAVVVVMATVGPAPVVRWAERLAQHRVDLVDAPVSGGAARASAGDLLIMVGGTEQAVARVQPLLDVMARSIDYPAPLASAAEQLYLAGRRAGLGRRDDSSVIEVLRARLSPPASQPGDSAR